MTSISSLSFNIFLATMLSMLAVIPALAASTPPTEIQSNDQQIERKVSALLKRFGIPGAAVLVYQKRQFNEFVIGYSDADQKTAVTPNTLFELGSVTKTFTTLLLAEQINCGAVQLQDTWDKLHSGPAKQAAATGSMTLLDLATHSSGLPKDAPGLPYNAADTEKQRQKLDQFLQRWKPSYPAGTQMVYSNLGFSLLGMGLATYQHRSLAELMQHDIFTPLNMTHATLDLQPAAPDFGRYAKGYASDDKPARTPEAGLLPASWALKASIEDMKGYLKAAVGEPETPVAILKAMKLAQTGYYDKVGAKNHVRLGLAWTVIPLEYLSPSDWNTQIGGKHGVISLKKIAAPQFDGNALIDKTGATDGFRAYIGVIPNRHVGIVILTNKFIYHPGAVRDVGRSVLAGLG